MSSAIEQAGLVERLKSLGPGKLSELRQTAAAGSVSGHALLAEALKRCGIRRIYGISGTPVDQTFAECAARSIRPVSASNQQAAVLMAAAGNYVAGRLESAVLVSAGPAVTNTVTGLLVAGANGWPVLVLGGRRALYQEGIGYFQELDAVPVLSPVTKLAATVRATSEIMEAVLGAFSTATIGHRGPVYLDLPEDVLEDCSLLSPAALPESPPRPVPDLQSLENTARLLAQAKRPLLIFGEDIRWSFDPESLRTLVADFGIPFITSPMGRGYLPDDHDLCGNEVRRWLQGQADVILMAGAWFDWRFRYGTELAADARIIHVDVNAATLGKNVTPSVAVLGEPGEFLNQLAGVLRAELNGEQKGRYYDWHKLLKHARQERRRSNQVLLAHPDRPMLPQQLYWALREVLPKNAIIAVEGNICLTAAQKVLQAWQPASWLDPGRNGLIGGSIPFAMGAKLACPERPSIALCSDSGFNMSAMNLEAAVRHRIPIVVVIANNDGNTGSIRQKKYFPPGYPERFSEYLPGLRYEQIMELFGGHGKNISAATEIGPALERALETDQPACLNVQLDPGAPSLGVW